MSFCDICAFDFNKTKHSSITCYRCDKICCKTCFCHFLIESSLSPVPSCLYCRDELTMDFVAENTPKTFFIQYQKYRADMKFKREVSFLPATQEIVNYRSKIKQLEHELSENNAEIRNVSSTIKILKSEMKQKKEKSDKSKIEKSEIKDMKLRISTLTMTRHSLDYISYQKNQEIVEMKKDKPTNRTTYNKPCPNNDCRGFLSSASKCGICTRYFCVDCNEEKSERNDALHICNEDSKASLAMIKLDSKPCPKCSALIYKIDGCHHMWCVKCHTSFDWISLRIIKSTNNPEYYRWMRENGMKQTQTEAVNNCNQFPTSLSFFLAISTNIAQDRWLPLLEYLMHIKEVVIPALPTSTTEIDNTELRVDFLSSKIDETKWKKLFMIRHKKFEVDHERFQILDMFRQSAEDLFMNFKDDQDIDTFEKQHEKLIKYANKQLLKINKRYNSKCMKWFLKTFPRKKVEEKEYHVLYSHPTDAIVL